MYFWLDSLKLFVFDEAFKHSERKIVVCTVNYDLHVMKIMFEIPKYLVKMSTH